jgi:hypothetical protein
MFQANKWSNNAATFLFTIVNLQMELNIATVEESYVTSEVDYQYHYLYLCLLLLHHAQYQPHQPLNIMMMMMKMILV